MAARREQTVLDGLCRGLREAAKAGRSLRHSARMASGGRRKRANQVRAGLLPDGRRLLPVKARRTSQVLVARATLVQVRLREEEARAIDAALTGEVGLHLTPGLLAARSTRTRPRWMTPDEGEDDGILVLGVDEELEAPTVPRAGRCSSTVCDGMEGIEESDSRKSVKRPRELSSFARNMGVEVSMLQNDRERRVASKPVSKRHASDRAKTLCGL